MTEALSPWNTAVIVARVAQPPASSPRMPTAAKAMLLLLLIACSNVGLISQLIAFSAGDAGNLFGLRDLAMIGFVIVSLPSVMRFKWRSFATAPVLTTLAMCLYAIPLAIRGVNAGNNGRDIAYEGVCVLGWLTGLCLLATLRSQGDVRFIVTACTWIGIAMSLGVIGEVAFRVPLVTGSAQFSDAFNREGVMRPTPSCWPFMLFSMANILAKVAIDRTAQPPKVAVLLLVLVGELMACVLTLSRTLLVGFVVTALCVAISIGRRGLRIYAIALAVILAAWLGGATVGDKMMGDRFSTALRERYSVFVDDAAAHRYSESEDRPEQWRAMYAALDDMWVLTGSGLGTPLSNIHTAFSSKLPVSDVSVIQLGVRFGLLGWVFLATFLAHSIRCLWKVKSARLGANWRPVGVAAGLCGVWTAGLFGNVWSMSYTAAPVMLLFFVSVAMHRAGTPGDPGESGRSRCSLPS